MWKSLIQDYFYSKNKLLGIDRVFWLKKEKNVYPVKIVRKGEINYNFSIFIDLKTMTNE